MSDLSATPGIGKIDTIFPIQGKYRNGIEYRQVEIETYFIDFIPGENDVLFFTFENAEKTNRAASNRKAWGVDAMRRLGYPVVGIKPKATNWYRAPDLYRFLESTEFQEFVKQFRGVGLYGSSMGGYAALAFAKIFPGSVVIAHNPQSTLSSLLVPWETRFKGGREQNWDGEYIDGAEAAKFASKIYISYDPFLKTDRQHADRVLNAAVPGGAEIIPIKVPFVGHAVPTWLLGMGILKPIAAGAAAGTLTAHEANVLTRRRRTISRYFVRMGYATRHAKHALLCLKAARAISATQYSIERMQIAKSRGLKEEARAIVSAGIEAAPNDAFFLHSAIKYAQWDKDINKAIGYCEQLLTSRAENIKDLHVAANVYETAKRIDEALDLMKRAIQMDEANASTHRIMARIYWSTQKRGSALAHIDRAIEIEPENKHAHALRSKILKLSSGG